MSFGRGGDSEIGGWGALNYGARGARRLPRYLSPPNPLRTSTMSMTEASTALTRLFAELVHGAKPGGGAFILNSGDAGFLRSLDTLSAADASRSVNGGATIAAHVQHLRFGLSLMNGWATDATDPHTNAKWDEAWKVSGVDTAQWDEIRTGLRAEALRWLDLLGASRDTSTQGL